MKSIRLAYLVLVLHAAALSLRAVVVPAPTPFLSASQMQMLAGILDVSLNYCLAPEVIGVSGLARTAYDDDAPLSYRHANITEWGYMMQAWFVAAERNKITRSEAVLKLHNALAGLEALRANGGEAYNGLFYNLYDVRAPNGTPLTVPTKLTGGAFIPSLDNALLTASLVVIEGWALHHGETALAQRAHAIWSTMDYRLFLVNTAGGGKAISHGYTPSTTSLLGSLYDVNSDEGGMMAWVAFLTNSITLEEFKVVCGAQKRWHGKAGGITVPEAPWFSAMFAWAVRQLGGFPAATRETGLRNRYAESFASATRGHLAQASRQGVFYPAYSDAMSQLYVGRYATPNLSGQESVFAHIMPHALFVPLNIGPELNATTRATLLTKIEALMSDSAVYYHAGVTGHSPFGFEVVASPSRNAVGYAGVSGQGGRYVFETLSQFYVIGSIFNGLAAHAGTPSFVHFACEVPGYESKLQTALAALYPSSFKVPADFATVQSAANAAIYRDVIDISPGTYTGNVILSKGVTLRGTRGGVVTVDDGGDDCVLDGASAGRVLSCDTGWPLDEVVLDGLTLKHGGLQNGAGLYLNRTSILVSHCQFSDCVTNHSGSGGYGGGIAALTGSDVTVTDSVFLRCDAWGAGGAVYSTQSALKLYRNALRDCTADAGGALFVQQPTSTTTARNNVFAVNYTTYEKGGAIYSSGSIDLLHNSFVGNFTPNFAQSQGGAVFIASGTAWIQNNILTGNRTATGGAGVDCASGVTASLITNDAYLNTLITGNVVAHYAGCAPDVASISTDPLFVNAAQRNYHLAPGSPAINAGSGVDADGSPADMGAYGGGGASMTYAEWIASFGISGPQSLATADADGDGLTNMAEFQLGGCPDRSDPASALTCQSAAGGWMLSYPQNNLALASSPRLQRSADLIQWIDVNTLATISNPEAGLSAVTVLMADDLGSRGFFRLVFP